MSQPNGQPAAESHEYRLRLGDGYVYLDIENFQKLVRELESYGVSANFLQSMPGEIKFNLLHHADS